MPLGCLIGLPCFADEHGAPRFSAGVRFSMCLSSLAPPMNYSTSTLPLPGKRIDVARNEIVKAALAQNAEHVLFLDTDVLFPPTAFMQLLNRQKNNPTHKIVSGVYWSKSNPSFPLVFEEAGCGSKMDWVVGDYIEADYAIGMGLVLIHTDVFRAIEPPWFEINYGVNLDRETGAMQSASLTEDLLFCEKASQAGFQIWVDTGIQAGHYDANSGVTFGLNDSMPQAQMRHPEDRETLYIGEILAGGEPAHVLAQDPTFQPTWIGPPDKVPTSRRYERVCVKDPEVSRDNLVSAATEWARVTEDSGTVEVLHPDYAQWIQEGRPVSSKALYPDSVMIGALQEAGLVEVTNTPQQGYHFIKARKPSRKTPLVSVIIVAKDLHEMTQQCIESVRKSTHKDFDFEIVLVDNASELPYGSIADKLVRTDRLSYGDAVNLGVVNANPDSAYLLLLNNDTVVTQHQWLENLLSRIRGQGQIAAVGPKQITPMGTIYHTEIGFTPERVPFHLFNGYAHDHPNVQQEKPVLALNFGAVLIRRLAFEKVPLDPQFDGIGNYSDIDWGLRVRKEGHALVYTPSSEIVHFGAQTQAKVPEESQKDIEANCKRFIEKWQDEAGALFGEEPGSVPAQQGVQE